VGKYADLLAEDPDFYGKLKVEAKRLTKEQKESERPLRIEADMREIATADDVTPSFLFGHAIIAKLWENMGMNSFLEKNCNKRDTKEIRNAICHLFAYLCSNPDSVRATAADQGRYAGFTPVGLDVFYSVLDVLSDLKEPLVEHLCTFIRKKTSKKMDQVCYEVTSFAFESTRWGQLRLFGFSQAHKNNEVQVVMGLLIDSNGIPITYELFPGNTMDQNTLKDSLASLKVLHHLASITVVTDRGMNSNDNLLFLHGSGYHFVVSYTLKRSKQEFKDAVFNDETPWAVEQYDDKTGQLTFASKILKQTLTAKVELSPEEVEVLKAQRKLEKKRGRCPKYKEEKIDAYVHVTYSLKRANKDAGDRSRMLERLKAKIKIETPGKLKAALMRGSNQYL